MKDSAVASSGGPDYAVAVELSITAAHPTQAAEFALDDLRDRSLGPINFNVTDLASGQTVPVSVGRSPSPHDLEEAATLESEVSSLLALEIANRNMELEDVARVIVQYGLMDPQAFRSAMQARIEKRQTEEAHAHPSYGM